MRLSTLLEERSGAYANANARVSLESRCYSNILLLIEEIDNAVIGSLRLTNFYSLDALPTLLT